MPEPVVSPFVTIILPIRNEANYIERCLETILQQDYPPEQIEILVVDGFSTDDTRRIVQQIAQCQPRIRLLDNAKGIVPTAMNIGLKEARGEIIVRVDGHCEIAPDYISNCVRLLQTYDVDCVGGMIETVGNGTVGEAIALAQSSFFGVGGVRFRNPNIDQEQLVDTLAFGAYRANVFQKIGLFDEELVRNQDDEFNFRLIQAGGKMLMSPTIRATYYSRATLASLWRQYYQYGYWKVRVMQKRRGFASWRHLVPISFVGALCLSMLTSLATRKFGWFLLVIGPYFLVNLFVSLRAALQKNRQLIFYLPVIFFYLHLSYGLGFAEGLIKFAGRWRDHA